MREIKFRIWDKVNKQMIWNSDIPFMEENFSEFIDCILGGCNPEKIPLQYTGLEDKNGKESKARWSPNHKNNKREAGKPRKVDWTTNGYVAGGLCLWAVSECEIIGNFYENPELRDNRN